MPSDNDLVGQYFRSRPYVTAGYAVTMLTFPIGIVVIPAVSGVMVDQIKSGLPFSEWKGKVLTILILFLVMLASYMIGMYIDGYASSDFQGFVRGKMLDRLMLSKAYNFSPVQVSSVVAKLIRVPVGMFELVKQYRNNLIPGLVTMIAITGYFFWVSCKVGWIVLFLLLAMIAIMAAGAYVCQDGLIASDYKIEEVIENQGDLLDNLIDTLSVGARDDEKEKRDTMRKEQLLFTSETINNANHFTGLVKIIVGLFIVAVVVYSWTQYQAKTLSSEKMMSMLFVLMCSRHILYNAMGAFPYLLRNNSDYIKLNQYLEQLDAEITKHKAKKRDAAPDFVKDMAPRPEVQFKNVWFGYDPSKPILKGVSFSASPGDKVLIEGPIGSGKSTIGKLVMGLHSADKGEVLIGGHNVAEMSRKAISKYACMIQQNPKLLNRTVYDVLRHGNKATRDQARKALETYGIDYAKLDDRMGKFGESFSTGQRILLMVARCHLQNAPVVVADEITSNLDPAATEKVVRALNKLSEGKVLLFISHAAPKSLLFTKTLRLRDGVF
jgi:ABC-type multidrug transport system fused ATPase/permease subunit